MTSTVAATFARYAGFRYAMQVHICPSRTRPVTAASALISDQASWVASSLGTGTVWKWSYTHTLVQSSLESARRASPAMTPQCCRGSIPTRSIRQPWGMNSPKCMPASCA